MRFVVLVSCIALTVALAPWPVRASKRGEPEESDPTKIDVDMAGPNTGKDDKGRSWFSFGGKKNKEKTEKTEKIEKKKEPKKKKGGSKPSSPFMRPLLGSPEMSTTKGGSKSGSPSSPLIWDVSEKLPASQNNPLAGSLESSVKETPDDFSAVEFSPGNPVADIKTVINALKRLDSVNIGSGRSPDYDNFPTYRALLFTHAHGDPLLLLAERLLKPVPADGMRLTKRQQMAAWRASARLLRTYLVHVGNGDIAQIPVVRSDVEQTINAFVGLLRRDDVPSDVAVAETYVEIFVWLHHPVVQAVLHGSQDERLQGALDAMRSKNLGAALKSLEAFQEAYDSAVKSQ